MIKLDQYTVRTGEIVPAAPPATSPEELFGPTTMVASSQPLPEHRLDYRRMRLARVLVIRMDNASDVIMTGPALRALRDALPEAKITLMTSPAGSQAAPLLPWVNDVIISEALWQDASVKVRFNPEHELGLIEQMRGHDLSAAFIFTGPWQSPLPAAYACYLAGIPYRIGFSRELSGGVLSFHSMPPAEETHQADRNLSLLETVSISGANRNLELAVPLEAQARADALLESLGIQQGMPFVLLAPGANSRTRRYDARRFAAVARLLASEAGVPVVITGQMQEAESIQPVIEVAAESRSGRVHSLVGRTSLTELAGLVRRASLAVTNNSAVMHIADAFQTPMVVLYSGTDMIAQQRPRSAHARLMCRPVFCAPCHAAQCPHAMECLDIRPDEVAIAALEMLAERFFFHLPARRIGVEV
jgi:lipopolysaccharide heptosyltransferase II